MTKHTHKFSKWKIVTDVEIVDEWGGTPKGRQIFRERKCKYCSFVEKSEPEVEVYG